MYRDVTEDAEKSVGLEGVKTERTEKESAFHETWLATPNQQYFEG